MDQYIEHDSLLHNSQQTKRDADVGDAVDDDKKSNSKSKRKRRSSLASTRRSISGNVNEDYSSDLPSSYSSSISSHSQAQNDNQKSSQLNPLNARMGEIISQFEDNITRLNQECTQWRLALKNLKQEQEQTKLLSECNIAISPDDVPQEIKELAKTEYMSALMDFGAMSQHVDSGLRQSYFDIQKCMQDMKLMRGVANTLKCHNKHTKASLSNPSEENKTKDDDDDDMMDTTTSEGHRHRLLTDLKSQMEWMMNN